MSSTTNEGFPAQPGEAPTEQTPATSDQVVEAAQDLDPPPETVDPETVDLDDPPRDEPPKAKKRRGKKTDLDT